MPVCPPTITIARPRTLALILVLVTAGLAGSAASVTGPAPPSGSIALTGARVLTMTDAVARSAQTVLVRAGRIAWVGPDAEAEIAADAVRIDTRGATLLPGLIDTHVHVGPEADALFVANGVTTVRRMHGNPEALAWRRANAAAGGAGPTVFVAGPLMAGVPTPWGHDLRPRTPAAATARVAEQASAGYDFIKIYDDLEPTIYAALTRAAAARGLPTVGHLPIAVGIDGMLAGGQRTLEHVEQLLFAHFGRDGADVRFVGVDLADGAIPDVPVDRLPEIVAQLEGADIFITPTLAAMRRAMARGTPWYEEQFLLPAMQYTSTYWVDWWEAGRGASYSEAEVARHRAFYEAQKRLTGLLHAAGVPIVAGTDTAAPLTPAGFSLADEIEELVAAGLSPFDALRAATVVAAEALGDAEQRGLIAVGAVADLLVVPGNPLEDINVLRSPRGVMLRGTWLDEAELRRRLAQVAAAR